MKNNKDNKTKKDVKLSSEKLVDISLENVTQEDAMSEAQVVSDLDIALEKEIAEDIDFDNIKNIKKANKAIQKSTKKQSQKSTKTNKQNKQKPWYKTTFGWVRFMFYSSVVVGFVLLSVVIWWFYKNSQELPDFRTMGDYKPNLTTKVYDKNGNLLLEMALQRRTYVPFNNIPTQLVNSFIVTEDKKFYSHNGFDILGIARAGFKTAFLHEKQGASTITQQLVKNMLLSNERSIKRKTKELILSYRIEKFLSKDNILELYLNEIYFGNRAYGVAAAAESYFSKSLDQLNLAEMATLAGLPKSPKYFNPILYPERSNERKNYILFRLYEEGKITKEEKEQAQAEIVKVNPKSLQIGSNAPYFAEYIRQRLITKYGENFISTAGYKVWTSLDPDIQKQAEKAVYFGTRDYDRRHGYRGAVVTDINEDIWPETISNLTKKYKYYSSFGVFARVVSILPNNAILELGDGSRVNLKTDAVAWAVPYREDAGKSVVEKTIPITDIKNVLKVNDVVLINKNKNLPEKVINLDPEDYSLEQIPDVESGFLALDSSSGSMLAMVGGISSYGLGFNRAFQAKRQVGSSFKPFVYTAALEKGFTPATLVLDAPLVFTDTNNKSWKPQNYSKAVFAPSPLRIGIEKSRNLMTIRLARSIGLNSVISTARKFGITATLEKNLSTALGSASINLYQMVKAYIPFVNLGRMPKAFAIERIEDKNGTTVFTAYPTCTLCQGDIADINKVPDIKIDSKEVTDPIIAYQVGDMMRGVVERGTAHSSIGANVKSKVGGKTGTTNDERDTWFIGFTPKMVAGVWLGKDDNKPLGGGEGGGFTAAPVWGYFMANVEKLENNLGYYQVPSDAVFVKIDQKTGYLPSKKTKEVITEVFKLGTEPNKETPPENALLQDMIKTVDFNGVY